VASQVGDQGGVRRLQGAGPCRVELDYLFLDAAHFKLRPGAPAEPVLCVWGVTTCGSPVLLGLASASDEGHDPWAGFLGRAGRAGLRAPLLVVTRRRARADQRRGTHLPAMTRQSSPRSAGVRSAGGCGPSLVSHCLVGDHRSRWPHGNRRVPAWTGLGKSWADHSRRLACREPVLVPPASSLALPTRFPDDQGGTGPCSSP
jgi:hypothetical protein